MNKARIARIARLVALRQQQRRLREARHSAAQREVHRAEVRRQNCASRCEALDHEHNERLRTEVSALDLELLGQARSHASDDRHTAEHHVSKASRAAERQREELLAAHKEHRSLEIYHDKADNEHRREAAKIEQRELDEIATQSAAMKRVWR